jgi:LysM repeat protein
LSTNDNIGVNQYIIQEGDTMWEIANQYDTTVEDLIAFNPEVDPDNMLIGQALAVPEQRPGMRPRPRIRPRPGRPAPYRPYRPYRPYQPYRPYYLSQRFCPRGTTSYYVQPGDSLYSIASEYGVSVDYIIASNPNINFSIPLRIGQIICLP